MHHDGSDIGGRVAKKAKVGDVFLIPIDGDRHGIGQIAGNWKGELYIVIYDGVVSTDASPSLIDGAAFQFAALSLDAKIHHGDWPIIGNRQDNIEAIPQPWFKVGYNGQAHVEARDRSVLRLATVAEEAGLRLHTVVAPVRLEKALKALHGVGDWHPAYDDLTAEYASESSKLVGDE